MRYNGLQFIAFLLIHLATTIQPVKLSVYESIQKITQLPIDFIPSGENVSKKCQIQSQVLRRGIEDTQLWALKIMDATAKIPSGILNGNLNQLGHFDQCLSAKSDSISGQYCLADVDITLRGTNLSHFDDRMHAFRSMTSQLSDPGQRLPKLSSFRWGLCVPSGCNSTDIKNHLAQQLTSKLNHIAEIDLRIEPDLCYTYNNRPSIGIGHYVAIAIFLTLAACIIIGSLQTDQLPVNASIHQKILACFSLKKNWQDLIKTSSDGDDIPIVHGGRALNALALLLSHKQMAQLYNPYVNALDIGKSQSGTWSMIGRAAILYTDSFILISGLLTAFSMIKELDRDKKINVKRSFLTRYIRFTPNLLFIILACTYLTDFLGPGPQWGLVVSKYSNFCKSNMWRNFLYIHNFFGFEDMCLTHTHQLGIDMQLFLASPIFIYLIWKHPKMGTFALFAVSAISTWLRYIVTIQNELSTVIYYGVSVDRLFKTARLSYILPTHRATVYSMGLLLGYGARRGLRQLKMSSAVARIGWSFAILFAVLAMFGPAHMAIRGYVYNVQDAAIYNALAPILWCLFLIWGTISSWNNQGGWFNDFLSWKYFIIFSRISYAVYLVQFPIFFYQVGTQRSSMYYEGLQGIIDIKELAIIMGSSVILTLAVDMPFQSVRKLLLTPTRKQQEIHSKGTINQQIPRTINHG